MPSGPPPTTRSLAASLIRRAAAGEPIARARLLVLDGPLAGCRLPLGGDDTLGRGSRATLRLDDPAASRLHLGLRVSGGEVRARDLGSKNGAAVNGRRLGRRPRRLRAGDVISLGASRLALELEAAPAGGRGEGPAGPPASRLLLAAAGALALGAAGALLLALG
jgi:predicted component of type VI protein secretion system